MKLAVVGATGLVGQEVLRVLEERDIEINELIPVASSKSAGLKISYKGKEYKVVEIEKGLKMKPDAAIFSAGSGISLEYAPKFEDAGCFVVDNSSAWRMSERHKLIVPEINGDILTRSDKIIANPNCSTIQMVLALAPLHKKYGIKRIVVSTYQSVTGTGKEAVNQLLAERAGKKAEMIYPHKIDMNVLPHIDVFLENGYTKEEMKMVKETQKILDDYQIAVTATAVRLPVIGGHSESVNVELNGDFQLDDIFDMLKNTPGIVVVDNPFENEYPMPINAHGKDEVFVGRLRIDESQARTLNMWIVSDNLRKGAATNAVQIIEVLAGKDLI